MKRYFSSITIILVFFIMLLHPSPVFIGAQKGLLLWANTVLPTLFPFMIISSIMIHTSTLSYISKIFGPICTGIFHTSSYASFAILGGFLCGYPMGAKITSDLILNHKISKEEGNYLLSFCNNTSPMFILSFVLWRHIGNPALVIPSMCILILSSILCSRLFYVFRYKKLLLYTKSSVAPEKKSNIFSIQILDDCIMKSIESIVQVGGYIILFSVIIELLENTLSLPEFMMIPLLSCLEITTGITLINASSYPAFIRWILSLALTSFGGFCAVAQTNCMIQKCGLPVKSYIIEKLITATVTSLLSYVYYAISM